MESVTPFSNGLNFLRRKWNQGVHPWPKLIDGERRVISRMLRCLIRRSQQQSDRDHKQRIRNFRHRFSRSNSSTVWPADTLYLWATTEDTFRLRELSATLRRFLIPSLFLHPNPVQLFTNFLEEIKHLLIHNIIRLQPNLAADAEEPVIIYK